MEQRIRAIDPSVVLVSCLNEIQRSEEIGDLDSVSSAVFVHDQEAIAQPSSLGVPALVHCETVRRYQGDKPGTLGHGEVEMVKVAAVHADYEARVLEASIYISGTLASDRSQISKPDLASASIMASSLDIIRATPVLPRRK